jgi:hypothetical protein
MGDFSINCGISNHAIFSERVVVLPLIQLYNKGQYSAITSNYLWTPYFFPFRGECDTYGRVEIDADNQNYELFRKLDATSFAELDYCVESNKTLFFMLEHVYDFILERQSKIIKTAYTYANEIEPFFKNRDSLYRMKKDGKLMSALEYDYKNFIAYYLDSTVNLKHDLLGIGNTVYDFEDQGLDVWFKDNLIKQLVFMTYLNKIRRVLQPNHSAGSQYEDYKELAIFDRKIAKYSSMQKRVIITY